MEGLPYSVDYLRRLFTREFGVTPQQYLIQLRMERARQILKQPGLSVTEAALSCGFYDARYFSRLFRRETGQTPSEYARHPSSFLST
nr:helix-turn-helix transcriptional regulator [Gehongia tenuis]